ncbi:preprotein translocase subunit YajC [Arcanobacterium sp. S3PF19]|uniref:preprotein translocase subunit YajC n=1 Tax=Arcanobacterium sp. S3PF19 TaxID=1219585 RepID=UPI00068ECE5C|nr:preprotein translocase subunit YajC [Arcanobacterium sp. S3PF19]
MDPITLIALVVVFGGMLLFMSRAGKKAQARAREEKQSALVVGNNVVTVGGFFGRIVDIDGDAVTLESPSGDETVWLKDAIRGQMDIPFAAVSEEEAAELDRQENARDDSQPAAENAAEGESDTEKESENN